MDTAAAPATGQAPAAPATALARLGHALSDRTRTRILLALRLAPATPSELADRLGVSRQAMSNQLACLRGCGLVETERRGRNTWYRLAGERLGPALGELLHLAAEFGPACDCAEGCRCP